MSNGPRKNENLYSSKNATVSLNSFLGLLSSTYGTEQLDSRIIFENDKVNWSNISVEKLKMLPKKESSSKTNILEDAKFNVGTSTTNLRHKNNNDDEIDETLLSIKSLTSLQQIKSELDSSVMDSEPSLGNGADLEGHDSKLSLSSFGGDQKYQMESLDHTEEIMDSYHLDKSPVFGLCINDSKNEVILDMKFVKIAPRDNELMPVFDIGEPEISISIQDFSKPLESTLKISKSNLVSKVKYFADVEKEFGLENLDVIAKCNFGVFQWVLQWLQSDIPMCKPQLNATNLKPILCMANHLGINQLIQECLTFFREQFDLVFEADREIEEVFSDEKLLVDFSKRFSNSEVERLKDDYFSFKNKLFCTLIKLLADPEPCEKIGHFSSLSTIFQCGLCEKIMDKQLANDIPCRIDCTQLTFDGKFKYHHECSSFWDLTKYLALMYEELKEWRLVYWKLWGICHFFYCEVCHSWYPLSQSGWCRYHPGEVEYFPMNNNLFHPIGTYRCCGEKVFRFNVVQRNGGCRYRNHVSKLDTLENVGKFNIHEDYKDLINQPPPAEDTNVRNFVKLVKKPEDSSMLQDETPTEYFWWKGLIVAPKEKQDYSLISTRVLNVLRNRPEKTKKPKLHAPLKFGVQAHFGSIVLQNNDPSESDSKLLGSIPSSSSHQIHTNKKVRPTFCVKKGKSSISYLGAKRAKKKKSLAFVYQPVESVWTDSEANKDNQDNQRDFEEIAMRKLVQMLTPADCSGSGKEDSAGTYIRLETEWWQKNCASHVNKNSSTVVNRTFPLSWFRKLTL